MTGSKRGNGRHGKDFHTDSGGFTRHPGSGISGGRRGTFAGLIDKIPYGPVDEFRDLVQALHPCRHGSHTRRRV